MGDTVIAIHGSKIVRLSLALVVALAALTIAAPAEAKRVRPHFFGMHDSRIAWGALPTVEVGAIRLWDSGTSWRQIERRPGRFDWTTLDRAVDTATAAGVRPLLVLGQTPRFHATRRNAPGAYGSGSTSMPRLRPWQRYVRKVANRYEDRIDYQIWNEPNVINYWTGSPAQMARLTASAARRITAAAGRRATVVAPSFPLRLNSQQKWYRAFWSQRLGGRSVARYVDVVAANLYPLERLGPEAQLPLLRYAKRALPDAARRKPMWNTEINYGLRGGPRARGISAAKEAAYVARTLVLNAASPIRRVYWYSWDISRIANTHLSRSDRVTRTRAGRAWDEVHDWLVGASMRGCRKAARGRTAGVYTCTVRAGRREVRRIYWKPSGGGVELATHRSTRTVTSLSGRTQDVDGSVRITVRRAPVMVTSRR